ncbi:FAD/NAD(P)-binding oxidoreductase family protein [Actinidia rufa]|uniref:FAD/NAD(P)-binding oxidoreductase family protein n=1 Tax=Actinidia rufa TaxID=165716 RepID=A0A7J0DAN8_9ERIC|nr:FAD/NAD(P)-binding oxidoreductase family protein [Actinidia rufa]
MAATEGIGGGGERKRVVVVGGGIAGSVAAKALQEHSNVVLIDSKEYFEVPWASLRITLNITESEVLTAQGDQIAYDYLVIATGHVDTGALARSEKFSLYHAGPQTRTKKLSQYQSGNSGDTLNRGGFRHSRIERKQFEDRSLVILVKDDALDGEKTEIVLAAVEMIGLWLREHEQIKSSNSILIVGGGPTGVELAGEVAVDFPDKKVTLVHRGSRLLEFIGHKAGRKALDWLTLKKVEVIFGQSVNLKSVSDDVVSNIWLMVDANLRVKGHRNVFGIGDITDIPEIKQGYLAQRHALVAAKNLKLLTMGGDERKMAVYKPGWPLAIVSLGRNEAVAQIFFVTLIGCFPGMIKSKRLVCGEDKEATWAQTRSSVS